jgi:hypothetical protein
VKRDLKDWCITKELALDKRVNASNSCVRTLISEFLLFQPSLLVFPRPFPLFFVWFIIVLLPPPPPPFHLSSTLAGFISILPYSNLLGTKRLCCCYCCDFDSLISDDTRLSYTNISSSLGTVYLTWSYPQIAAFVQNYCKLIKIKVSYQPFFQNSDHQNS